MFRVLTHLSLALISAASLPLGERPKATWHAFVLAGRPPAPQQKKSAEAPGIKSPSSQTATQYYVEQQQVAEQQIAAAEVDLERNIAFLQQSLKQNPNSPQLNAAISSLQNLLVRVRQAAANVQHAKTVQAASPGGPADAATLVRLAKETDQLKQISGNAQTEASQGSALAAMTVANLGRTAAPGEAHHLQAKPVVPPAVLAQILPPTVDVDRGPASVPQVGPPPPDKPAVATPIADSSGETAWFETLKNGLLQYSVPETMLWKVPSTVTVQISGEKAPSTGAIDSQTGQTTLKVARYMKVLVSAPDNPDEFTIATETDTQLEQFVPEDGPTTWHFSVTPRYTATSQKLVVQAWVIYDANTQRELPVYQTVVNVHVPSLVECVKRLFEGDPDYWLKYGLPGGAGFIFVSGALAGLWKWFTKKRNQSRPATG